LGASLDLETDVDWDRTAFGLICPDAIARHLAVPIMRRINDSGFSPLSWKVFWHRPTGIDAYFERNITQVWRAYVYRLADRVFDSGPTIAVLWYDRTPTGEVTSHQRLRALKGSSEPHKAKAGTIRGDFRSINVSLGLMHSADSAEESRREAGVFVGPGEFRAGLDPAEFPALLGMLESIRPAEERDFDDVLAGLRARIVSVLWEDLPAEARELADKLRAGGITSLAAPGAGAQLADHLPAGHPLEPVLRCEFSEGNPGLDIERVGAILRAYGTDLDTWEDLVLATSMRFAPRRRTA
jgi:nucleoside diphosphate kinase